MVYRERDYMAMLLAASLSLATGCVVEGDETWADDCMSEGHGDGSDDDDGTTEGGDGTGDDGDGTGHEGDDGTSDGDEGLTGCAANGTVEACMDALGCAPVFGHALIEDLDGGWCTEQALLYLGCVSTLDKCPHPEKIDCEPCAGGEKILCDEDSYWLTNDCVPDNLAECSAPGQLSGACS